MIAMVKFLQLFCPLRVLDGRFTSKKTQLQAWVNQQ